MKSKLRPFAIMCCMGLLLAGALVLRGLGQEDAVRYLIIHTDDAGMCPAVNDATIEAMEQGSVTSASIMAPCPGFKEFAEYAASHPELDWGVHLTLNSEASAGARWGPISGRQKVPSLIGDDGWFPRSTEAVAEHAKLDEVELELRAQIERVKSAGVRLSHLDHHMWVMLSRPDLFQLYVRLGIEYDLPVRIHKQLPDGFSTWSANDPAQTYRKALDILDEHRFPQFDFIDTDNYDAPAKEKREHFLNVLRGLKPGVSEFVVHVAYERANTDRAPAAAGRQADLRTFTSLEFEDEIRTLGIKLITWKRFREMTNHGPPRKETRRISDLGKVPSVIGGAASEDRLRQ